MRVTLLWLKKLKQKGDNLHTSSSHLQQASLASDLQHSELVGKIGLSTPISLIMIVLFEAFPAARCVSKVASPQPVELLSEESSDSQSEPAVKPIILTSGMGPQVCRARLPLEGLMRCCYCSHMCTQHRSTWDTDMHTWTHAYSHAHTHTCIQACMHIYLTYTATHTHIHTFRYAHSYLLIHACLLTFQINKWKQFLDLYVKATFYFVC